MAKQRATFKDQTEEQRTAMHRMALFPDKAEVLFIAGDMWVVSAVFLAELPQAQLVYLSWRISCADCYLTARNPAGKETMRVTRHTQLIPEDASRPRAVFASASDGITTFADAGLHYVRFLDAFIS